MFHPYPSSHQGRFWSSTLFTKKKIVVVYLQFSGGKIRKDFEVSCRTRWNAKEIMWSGNYYFKLIYIDDITSSFLINVNVNFFWISYIFNTACWSTISRAPQWKRARLSHDFILTSSVHTPPQFHLSRHQVQLEAWDGVEGKHFSTHAQYNCFRLLSPWEQFILRTQLRETVNRHSITVQ